MDPKWSGLVTGYPVNTLPVIALLHFHYGLDVARAIMKVWPLGAFGICVFNLVAWLTVVRLGLTASVPLGYVADFIYLLSFDALRRGGGARGVGLTSRTARPRAATRVPIDEVDLARMNRRRALVTLLGLGLGLPAARGASAQAAAKVPVVGLLDAGQRLEWWVEFRQQLHELGYVEGRTVAFEERFANGKFERLPALAQELVRLKVAVIVTSGTVTAQDRPQGHQHDPHRHGHR